MASGRSRFRSGALGLGLLLGAAALAAGTVADADAAPLKRRVAAGARPVRMAGPPRALTIRRHLVRRGPGAVVAGAGPAWGYGGPGIVRRWNDPNLYSFGGWRLGGEVFYGDTRGAAITRGNAGLAAISGYGGARGGFGGPHFDSVGGFHPGPGPEAQESDDYASGSISTPDYGGVVPRYPGIKERVARLNAGIPMRAASAATPASYTAREPAVGQDDAFGGSF